MSQHLALILPEKQAAWEVGSRPTPKPSPGEVLVKVLATALNPLDWKNQKLGLFVQQYPVVVGYDSAGVVQEVGEGVTSLAIGDRVLHQATMGPSNDMASHQQYALAEAELVSRIPASLSFDEACSIPLGLATAAVALYLPLGEAFKPVRPDGNAGIGLTPPWTPEGRGKYKGQSIVIVAGSSSMGQFGIQLAKLSGFSTIVTTSSKVHEEYLKSLGATHVIDRHGDQVAAIKSVLENGMTDVVYDGVSNEDTQKVAVAVSSPKASIALTRLLEKNIDVGERFVVTTFGSTHVQRKLGIALYNALPELLETGAVKGNRPEVLPGGLKGVADGLERLFNNDVSGVKLVGHPWD